MYAFLRLLPLAFLACSGCLTTLTWQHAVHPELEEPVLVGTTGDDPHRVAVIYGYDDWGQSRTHFALPADKDGRLTGPLVYEGRARTARGIAADLSPEQQRALARYRFTDFHRISRGEVVAYTGNAAADDADVYLYIAQLDCVAVALDPADRPLPLQRRSPRGSSADDIAELADDARIILLPNAQPRPFRDQAAAVGRAVLLTPLALAGDAVLMPLLCFFILADQ